MQKNIGKILDVEVQNKQARPRSGQALILPNLLLAPEKTDPPPPWGNNLHPDVAEKYKLQPIKAGKYAFKGFGEIDLRRITLAKADELYKSGFKFLKLNNK